VPAEPALCTALGEGNPVQQIDHGPLVVRPILGLATVVLSVTANTSSKRHAASVRCNGDRPRGS
jgi:hypothetical protein